jgi:hypothetical protein
MHSSSHGCRGKSNNKTHSKFMFAALGNQHAVRMCDVAICGLSVSTLFFYIISKRLDFRKKKSHWIRNMCFDFPYKFVCKVSPCKKNWTKYYPKYTLVLMYGGCYSCQILLKIYLYIFLQISEKYSSIRFHENPAIGSRVVQCGRTARWTARHDEANSSFSKFCERPYKDKISSAKISNLAYVGIKCMWDLVAKSERKRLL